MRQTRLKTLFLFFWAFQCTIGAVAQTFSGGSGTELDPYQIATPEDLVELSTTSNQNELWTNKHYKITADLDMTGKPIFPIGTTKSIFYGTIYGDYHTINNLTITPNTEEGSAATGTGLFGAFNGSLSALGVKNISLTASGYSRVGALVGMLEGGTVEYCYCEDGEINVGNGGWTGAIVGAMFAGGSKTVQNCYSNTSIKAGWASGGIVGATRGEHKIDNVAFYGTVKGGNAIVTIQNDPTNGEKNGIAPTNAYYKSSTGANDENATALSDDQLVLEDSYNGFDFETYWEIDTDKGYATLQVVEYQEPEYTYFDKLRMSSQQSTDLLEWKQFGPGMAGYCEEFWCHPTDENVMFMGPDMHVTYGTWDNGESWQTIKNCDGDGLDLERVNDIVFSTQNPDFGLALERRGKVFRTDDRGHTWTLVSMLDHGAVSPWYNAHSQIAIHPTNDDIWFIGAGGFWDVKGNHRQVSNPEGLPIDLYAYGYMLKTSNAGSNWKKVADNISSKLDIGRIEIDPSNPENIVICTGQGIFRSTDTGETWQESSTGLPNNIPRDLTSYYDSSTKEYILYLVEQTVFEENANEIIAKGGVYQSTDGGISWTSITGNLGLDFTQISHGSLKDDYASAVAYWLGTTKAEVKEKAYPTQTLQVFNRIAVNPQDKNEIYLVTNQRHDKSFSPGDTWKTEDGGTTWTICSRHGAYWIAETDKAYWESKGIETGANIEFAHLQASINENLESSNGNRMLAINRLGEVIMGINQQTIRSNNGGKSWFQIDDYETAPGSNVWIGRGDSDMPGRQIVANTGVPGRILLCTGEHGLWQTADLGNWKDRDAVAVEQIEGQVHDINGNHSVHSVSCIAVHPNDPNIIFMLAWRQEHRGWLRKTTDGGKTWENVVRLFDTDNMLHEATASQNSLMIDPKNPDNMYFTATYKPVSCGTNSGPGKDLTLGEYGVYKSSDGGNTWTPSNTGLPEGASVNRLTMHPENTEKIYAALNLWNNTTDPYGLYVSDKADNWTQVTIPSKVRSVNNIFIDPTTKDLYISCGYRGGTSEQGGVYRSKDEGSSWEKIFDAPYIWYTETSPVEPNYILVNAAGQTGGAYKNPGLYLSQDGGENWSKINKGLGQPDKMVDIEFDHYNKNIMYSAAWGSGWYKGMIKTDEIKAQAPESIEIKEGEKMTLYGLGSIGEQLNYNWAGPSGFLFSSTNKVLTTITAPQVDEDTNYTITLTINNSKGSDRKEIQVTVKNETITNNETITKSDLTVFPNPVQNELTIQYNGNPIKQVSIFNANGKKIDEFFNINVINVENLNKGVYLMKIVSNNETATRKFMKL